MLKCVFSSDIGGFYRLGESYVKGWSILWATYYGVSFVE